MFSLLMVTLTAGFRYWYFTVIIRFAHKKFWEWADSILCLVILTWCGFLAMAYEVFSFSSHSIFRFRSRCSPSKPTMAQTQKSSTLDLLWSCFFFKFVCLFFYPFVFLLCVLGPRGAPSAFCGGHCCRRLQRSVYFFIFKNNI